METADQRKTETAPLSQEKLSEYRKVLANVENAPVRLNSAIKEFKNYPSNPKSDLEIAQDHFGKLKYNLAELRAKELFVDTFAEYNLGDEPAPFVSAEEVSLTKNAVKDIKNSNVQLRDSMVKVVSDACSELASFEEEFAATSQLMQELEDVNTEYEGWCDKMDQQTKQLQDAGVQDDQNIYANLEEEVNALTVETNSSKRTDERLSKDQQQYTEQMSAMQDELNALKENMTSSQHMAHAKLQQDYDDAVSENLLLTCMSGIEVERESQDCLELKLVGWTDRKIQLAIIRDVETGRMKQILLEGSDALIKSLTAEAIQENDLPKAIAAVKEYLEERYNSESK